MYSIQSYNPDNPYGAKKLYKVLNVKRYMNIKDGRATRRVVNPTKVKGMILVDDSRLDTITFDCDILPRNGCWEICIYNEDIAKNVKTLATEMDAVAYFNVIRNNYKV